MHPSLPPSLSASTQVGEVPAFPVRYAIRTPGACSQGGVAYAAGHGSPSAVKCVVPLRGEVGRPHCQQATPYKSYIGDCCTGADTSSPTLPGLSPEQASHSYSTIIHSYSNRRIIVLYIIYTPAINKGCTRSVRISHSMYCIVPTTWWFYHRFHALLITRLTSPV